MSEETKHPKTPNGITEQDEGRCAPAPGSVAINYQEITYRARDILNCGHVSSIPDALASLYTRYNDALAHIATLEHQSPNK